MCICVIEALIRHKQIQNSFPGSKDIVICKVKHFVSRWYLGPRLVLEWLYLVVPMVARLEVMSLDLADPN